MSVFSLADKKISQSIEIGDESGIVAKESSYFHCMINKLKCFKLWLSYFDQILV